MKIRSDFVSNSSSSSFMIIGINVDCEYMVNTLRRLDPVNEFLKDWDKNDCYTFEIALALKQVAKKQFNVDINLEQGIDRYYGEYCFGKYLQDMKDDETKKHFFDSVSEDLSKIFGYKVTAKELIDGGSDN